MPSCFDKITIAPYARPDYNSHLIVFQISHIATFYASELLSWEKSDKYRNELRFVAV